MLCVEGRPTVYFKRVKAKDSKCELNWQRKLWNQGAATMLVVDDASEVRIYSALAKPASGSITAPDDERLVTTLTWAADALELQQFIRGVETGAFYRRHAPRFQPERSVDRYLLDNLCAARDELCDYSKGDGLDRDTAHHFLGRCLFTGYLLEREVIGSRQLRKVGAPAARNLRELLESMTGSQAIDTLYALFRLLQDDFNGSLFGNQLPGEQKHIRVRHIEVLKRFFRGDDFKAGQPALTGFDLYDFSFIPIELISAIYEQFLAAPAPEADDDEEASDEQSKSQRRKAGAYYTPPRLAELVVDIATEKWPTLLKKRYLDPACGSGIFLVVLFQRMAGEWRRRNSTATNLKRACELRRILTESLCGVDRDPTACMIASFSLYLAFLDQFDPPDIWALKKELEAAGEGKVLPPLTLVAGDAAKPAKHAIHAKNFFAPETDALGKFDLVIGNPPWIGRNQPGDEAAEKWLFSEANPFLIEIKAQAQKQKKKPDLKAVFLPAQQSAIAFMWRAPLFAKADGIVCLLLPSRVLLSNQTDAFQAAWFARFQVECVWQLADYRRILFSGAKCPAVVIKNRIDRPADEGQMIEYITPKAERLDPRQAVIPVLPEDRKMVPLDSLALRAKEDRAFIVWKEFFWGTGRDRGFLDRLLKLPPLSKIAGKIKRDKAGQVLERKRWVKGQGFQPPSKSMEIPKDPGWKPSDLFLDAGNKRPQLILLESDCKPIGREIGELRRKPDDAIFAAPMVLVNQGFTRFVFSPFPVYFQDSLQSIAGPPEDENLLLFLTAVLNSPLASYFFFHTSANLGVERDKVHFEELLQLPFPLPEETDDPDRSWAIVRKAAARLHQVKADIGPAFALDPKREQICADAKADLNELVYDYFEVSARERVLIEDTVEIYRKSITPSPARLNRIPTLTESKEPQRQEYAHYLRDALNGWAKRSAWRVSPKGQLAERAGLCLLTLTKVQRAEDYVEEKAAQEFEKVMKRLSRASAEQQGGITYLRGFALIEKECIHILKPLALRHWTKSAALNDADDLLGDLLFGGENR